MQFTRLLSLLLVSLAAVHAAPISHDEIVSNAAKGLRLLSITEGADPVWKTPDEVLELMRAGTKFFDVTEVFEDQKDWVKPEGKVMKSVQAFASPSHQTAVKAITATLSTSNMNTNLASLTAFNNRYYKSSTGASASTWIQTKVQSYIDTYSRSDVTVSLFTHSWVQSSIIAKIPGSTTSNPIVIVGAHMDSINLDSPTSGRAPGADDDGTGTVNLLETFRALLAAGFKPTSPVEFHWYSGEEAGLLGSQAIATSYKNAGKKLKAFMELDMSGYFKPGSTEVIALEADYISSDLNTFLRSLAASYSTLPVTMDTPCGYACSDHSSWYNAGYATSFPYEAVTGNDDPQIHGTGDTTSVSGFSWAHSLEFTKLAVGFVYELAI